MFRHTSVAAVALALGATMAHAGGAGLYEMATPDLGTAAAGRAALAMDASTAWGNPAGMMALKGTQFMLGLQPTYTATEFQPSEETDVRGNSGGNAGGFGTLPGLYFTRRLGDHYAFGVSLASNLAAALEYDDGWVGRYHVDRTELVTMSLNPVFAYRLEKWLSVGFGVNVVFGSYEETSSVNNRLDVKTEDGQIRFSDRATGVGANLGILFGTRDGARVGLTYRSPVNLGFEGWTTTSGIGPNLQTLLEQLGLTGLQVDADITVPEETMVSAYQPVGDRFALLANAGWQRWTEFGRVNIAVSDTTSGITAKQPLDDTWHAALGLHYRMSEPWLLMAGFSYDASASTDDDRALSLPVDRQYRFAGGARWSASKQTALSFAYEFADFGSAPVKQEGLLAGTVAGDYSPNYGHFLAVSVNRTW